ncbi:MAG: DUF2332 domain-containing protein [Hyphomonadaceae bacterium]|nr:DUF2332 domain-containing protein [Hyphomonadaceae bacterium]
MSSLVSPDWGETLAEHFRAQAAWGERLGSPFTAALLEGAAANIDASGWVARVMGGRDWVAADAAPLRFAGALHAAALQKRDAALVGAYTRFDAACALEAGETFAARDPDFFASFLDYAPQTNETRRAIGLLPAFLAVGADGAPMHMLELGASAGLNLNWDKFQYRTQSWRWRDEGPQIETDWRGAAPTLAPLTVASRAGCDIHPLDIFRPEEALRLRAYIWADQRERLARFDAALALAQSERTRVEQADAAAWLERRLGGELQEGATVLYHSIVWQYFPKDIRARCRAAIEAGAARATPQRRLAWVRFEHDRVLKQDGDGYSVDLQTWPGGERKLVARVDPHVRWVEAG